MLRDIKVNLDIVRSHPSLAETPVFADECDPGVPSHMGIFDNRNYGFRNTAYYAVFQLQLMTALVDGPPGGRRGVSLATAWAWYMEGDRYFEGTRSFFTASDIPLPVTNAYRMLSMLGTGGSIIGCRTPHQVLRRLDGSVFFQRSRGTEVSLPSYGTTTTTSTSVG